MIRYFYHKIEIIRLFFFVVYRSVYASVVDPDGRAVYGVGRRPLASWDCGFESRRGGMDVCIF